MTSHWPYYGAETASPTWQPFTPPSPPDPASPEYWAAQEHRQQETLARRRAQVIAAGEFRVSQVDQCLVEGARRGFIPGSTPASRELNCIHAAIGREPAPPLTPQEIQVAEASPIGLPYGGGDRHPPGPEPEMFSIERLAWNDESRRRTAANKVALRQLEAGAAQGWCEPCAKLQWKHDAEAAAIASTPDPMMAGLADYQSRLGLALGERFGTSYAAPQAVPPECAACDPLPAGVPLLRPQGEAAPPPFDPFFTPERRATLVKLGLTGSVLMLLGGATAVWMVWTTFIRPRRT